MATTIEELEKRVRQLEEEVAHLRKWTEGSPTDETPLERGIRLRIEARRSQKSLEAAFDKFLKEMGIEGEPIGAEKLQEMIAAEGIIKPEDNEFSRGIIEMREE